MNRENHAIVHFDVAGPEVAALATFYGGLFGWKIESPGPGYAQVETNGGLRGALVEAERAATTLGVQVADLAASLERAVAGGGTVVMPITDNGWVVKAVVADPAGNAITLVQADRE
jgi:hypothetical protein